MSNPADERFLSLRERNADLLAALEVMLAAYSLAAEYGPEASARRLDAKKQARAAIARAKSHTPEAVQRVVPYYACSEGVPGCTQRVGHSHTK